MILFCLIIPAREIHFILFLLNSNKILTEISHNFTQKMFRARSEGSFKNFKK